ncbi:MAG: antitoxin [Armatimonadetes bacterium CG_4_10_14_0_8_um_filter_66_14]|nr:MAG: antitoxin [Armatimonadetes bacterium CG_4_10_14_0_8_um_filter_66_14]
MHRGLIAVDATVCHGKPCIRGTRILVSSILSQLAGGYAYQRLSLKAGYPELGDEHIRAAIDYARNVAWAASSATVRVSA